MTDVKEVYQMINQLEELAKRQQTQKLVCAAQEGVDDTYIRKLLEYVFRKIDILIVYLTTKAKGGHLKEGYIRKTSREPIEEITIRSEGKTYAELLKTVKQKIDIGKIGVKVKYLRQTGKDYVTLRVVAQSTQAGELQNALRTNIGDATVQTKRTTLFITDIDATIKMEKVLQVLKEETGENDPSKIRIVSMRPNREGNQTASVAIMRDLGAKLLRKGIIKIGWVSCRIRERVSILRCYRCLKFGHVKSACQGPD